MEKRITVNKFDVHYWEGGYPAWVQIEYDGKGLIGIHHTEVQDLEYALGRIRDLIRVSLGEKNKHEA